MSFFANADMGKTGNTIQQDVRMQNNKVKTDLYLDRWWSLSNNAFRLTIICTSVINIEEIWTLLQMKYFLKNIKVIVFASKQHKCAYLLTVYVSCIIYCKTTVLKVNIKCKLFFSIK